MIFPIPLPLKEQFRDKVKVMFYLFLIVIIFILAYVSFSNSEIIQGAVIGGSCGIFGHYSMTRTSELHILGGKFYGGLIEDYLYEMRYRKSERDGIFVPDIHRLLRFDAQNVRVLDNREEWLVIGPLYILKKLSVRLR